MEGVSANCHKKGKALVRGTKCGAGLGQGGGFPLRRWKENGNQKMLKMIIEAIQNRVKVCVK